MQNRNLKNPFEYEAAVHFADDDLIELFVEDHNYSRFIQSPRNIFIVGERGSGKSMSLLFNSYPKQKKKAENEGKTFDFATFGVYVPCTNPLFFKSEYEITNTAFKASVISEHFLVLAIAFELSSALASAKFPITKKIEDKIRSDLNYILNIKLREELGVFEALTQYFQKISCETQDQVNNSDDSIADRCVSFYSLVIPLIKIIKEIKTISATHFLLLIDDAHDLNAYQVKSLNSWIAYRDHSDFSFKVAIAKVRRHSYITSTGSSILEGHDFLKIDMEKPYQNKFSDFGLWANDIVVRRLEKFGLSTTNVAGFFPVNPKVEQELKECEAKVRQEAEALYKDDPKKAKKISDYVYKYARAEYFKNRPAQANLPQYSGWETIVHLSTGVVRNLLYPCYWMFDKEYSTLVSPPGVNVLVSHIRPSYQDEVIKEKSQELWSKIKNDLFNNIDNCSTKQAEQIKNLFENLILLFRERLVSDVSEPRAITFSISAVDRLTDLQKNEFEDLLRIAKEAQLLYDREASAKEAGERETYYVPNRLLFPVRGLDVVGQHARVSIQAIELYKAAVSNKKINVKEETQQSLFKNEI